MSLNQIHVEPDRYLRCLRQGVVSCTEVRYQQKASAPLAILFTSSRYCSAIFIHRLCVHLAEYAKLTVVA